MDLFEATWTEAEAADPAAALVPVGATEQHGPHAPLGTDAITAEAVAERGAAACDSEVVVTPPLPVGVSEEHRGFAGTLWVQPDTFRATIRDVIESLAHHGWDRIVVVNGHGGNVGPLREAAARATRDGVAEVAAFTWFEAIDAPEMGHGGPAETSVLAAVRPDSLREERLAEAADGAAERWGKWAGGTNLAYDTDAFSENGVVGDPTDATAERGDDLLDDASEALRAVVAALADGTD